MEKLTLSSRNIQTLFMDFILNNLPSLSQEAYEDPALINLLDSFLPYC